MKNKENAPQMAKQRGSHGRILWELPAGPQFSRQIDINQHRNPTSIPTSPHNRRGDPQTPMRDQNVQLMKHAGIPNAIPRLTPPIRIRGDVTSVTGQNDAGLGEEAAGRGGARGAEGEGRGIRRGVEDCDEESAKVVIGKR